MKNANATENTEYQVKVYLAAGWFNPTQAEELDQLEKVCDDREWIDLASPRRIFVCPPDAPKEAQDETFLGNLREIQEANFLIVNTVIQSLSFEFPKVLSIYSLWNFHYYNIFSNPNNFSNSFMVIFSKRRSVKDAKSSN